MTCASYQRVAQCPRRHPTSRVTRGTATLSAAPAEHVGNPKAMAFPARRRIKLDMRLTCGPGPFAPPRPLALVSIQAQATPSSPGRTATLRARALRAAYERNNSTLPLLPIQHRSLARPGQERAGRYRRWQCKAIRPRVQTILQACCIAVAARGDIVFPRVDTHVRPRSADPISRAF